MIVNIIITTILFICLIAMIHIVIVGIRIKSYQLSVSCGIGAGLIGMLFGRALGSILFNI